jgi:hypothetical protein
MKKAAVDVKNAVLVKVDTVLAPILKSLANESSPAKKRGRPKRMHPSSGASASTSQEALVVKKAAPFISTDEFNKGTDDTKSTFLKWRELPVDTIYRVDELNTCTVMIHGLLRQSPIARLCDNENHSVTVWLPTIVTRKLHAAMGENKIIYVRALPAKVAKSGNIYFDADVMTV